MKRFSVSVLICLILTMAFPVVSVNAITATIDISHSDIETELAASLTDPLTVTALNITGDVKPRDYNYIMEQLTRLETLHLADETDIPTKAFYDLNEDMGHPSLRQVTAPEAKTVGARAFCKMPSLYRVKLNGATNIEWGAFAYCPKLRIADLPSCVNIASNSFEECVSLETVNIPKVLLVCERAFYGTKSLKNLTMDAQAHIMEYAFYDCDSLTNVEIEAVEIGEYAFSDCESLKVFSAPNATILKEGALSNCGSLEKVELNSIISVGSGAFENDSSLTSLTIGAYIPDFDGAWNTCFKGTPPNLKVYTEGRYTDQQCQNLAEFINKAGGTEFDVSDISEIDLPTENISDAELKGDGVRFDVPSVDMSNVIAKENTTTSDWKTMNSNIVDVDENGVVTGKQAGTAIVTGKVVEEGEQTVSKDVFFEVCVTDDEGNLSVTIKQIAEKVTGSVQSATQTIEEDKIQPPKTAENDGVKIVFCVFVAVVAYFGMKYSDKIELFFAKFVPKKQKV